VGSRNHASQDVNVIYDTKVFDPYYTTDHASFTSIFFLCVWGHNFIPKPKPKCAPTSAFLKWLV
jgi:hypothetical protein